MNNIKKCIVCEKDIRKAINRSRKSWKKQKFCSRQCHSLSLKGKPTWNKGLKGMQIAWNKGLGLNSRICRCGNIKPNHYAKQCWQCYKKQSHIPWNKGRKLSLELRKKLSKAHIGKQKGNRNPAWKGGITPITIRMRNQFIKRIHKEILKRDDYTCQICGQRGGDLNVDHIQPWAEYVELRFSMDNCRTLCISCHYKITFGRPIPKNSKWGRSSQWL